MITITCEKCGAVAVKRRPTRFCSRRCYWDSQVGKPTPIPREKLGGGREKQRTALLGRPQSPEHVKNRVEAVRRSVAKTTRQCKKCGEWFTPSQAAQRYCSGRCWTAVARLRRPKIVRFTISRDEYEARLMRQGGACAVCGKHQRALKHRLAVDHCHASMRVRGLLCHRCNTALGLLGDDPAVVRKAAKYLTKHQRSEGDT